MANYIITESSPSTAFIRSGRGGAGNFHPRKSSPSSSSSSPPSTSSSSLSQASTLHQSPLSSTSTTLHQTPTSTTPRRFFSGIGGAGNAHSAREQRPARSIDEEYQRVAARDGKLKAGHCGIGGAGNVWKMKKMGWGMGLRRGSVGTEGSEEKLVKA